MSQALTPTASSTAVRKYGDEDQIKFEMQAMRASLPGAMQMDWQNKTKYLVSDELLRGLVIASKYSGLNPYAGEIYAIPGVGVTTASKIKVGDAIAAAQRRGDTLNIRFETVREGSELWEANAEEFDLRTGDTVRACVIISGKAREEYFKARMHRLQELQMLYPERDNRQMIDDTLRKEFPSPPMYVSIAVVKSTERDGSERKLSENKFVAFTRTDRADKRALIRCINRNGLAAPDQRNYGSVQIVDDGANVIDAPFQVRGTSSYTNDNAFPGADDAPPPTEQKTAQPPITDEQRQRNTDALRGREDLKSSQPFGEEPLPDPLAAIRKEWAHWRDQVKAIGQDPCTPPEKPTAAQVQECIDKMKQMIDAFNNIGKQ